MGGNSMLTERISVDDIQIGIQAKDWEDAIIKTSEILLNKKKIEQGYIDAIIEALKENGPYIVIRKHVALAHARPEFGAKALGLTFSTMNPPISFGAGSLDPIKLIITLSATNEDTHIDLMGELAEILLDNEKVEALFNAKSKDEFFDLMKS